MNDGNRFSRFARFNGLDRILSQSQSAAHDSWFGNGSDVGGRCDDRRGWCWIDLFGGSRDGSICGARSATFGSRGLFRSGGGRGGRSYGVRVRLVFFGGFFRNESTALEQLQNLRIAADLGNLSDGSFTATGAVRGWCWRHIRFRFGEIRVRRFHSRCTW